MRIAIALNSLGPGGAERVSVGLANYLSNFDEVSIHCVTQTGCNPYHIDEKVTLYPGAPRDASNATKAMRFTRILRSWSPDVIFVLSFRVDILCLLSPCLRRFPIVISERNDPEAIKNPVWRLLRRVSYQKARGMVFQTPEASAYYGWYKGKRDVIPNPVKAPYEPSPILSRPKRAIMVNRLEKQKNVIMGVDAFFNAVNKEDGYILSVYGSGSLHAQVKNHINKRGMEPRVKLEGVTDDIYSELDSSRLFLLSSEYEGMPNALLEAMSMGLVVISTDCPAGGPRNVVENGVNGFLVAVGDCTAMADAVRVAISDDKLMERLSNAAVQSIKHLEPVQIFARWRSFAYEVLGRAV